jgi:ferrous iron transport protein A
MRNLSDLEFNSSAKILALDGDPIVVARLREMGFVPGQSVTLWRTAPFGEPYLIEIRGAVVALRREEAKCVLV